MNVAFSLGRNETVTEFEWLDSIQKYSTEFDRYLYGYIYKKPKHKHISIAVATTDKIWNLRETTLEEHV